MPVEVGVHDFLAGVEVHDGFPLEVGAFDDGDFHSAALNELFLVEKS